MYKRKYALLENQKLRMKPFSDGVFHAWRFEGKVFKQLSNYVKTPLQDLLGTTDFECLHNVSRYIFHSIK